MSAWILIPVFVAGMLTGGTLVLMWANHPWTIPETTEQEDMEVKTAVHWARRGYTFVRNGECPACQSPVEFWKSPTDMETPINAMSYEAHFSACPRAKEYRTDKRMEAGIL